MIHVKHGFTAGLAYGLIHVKHLAALDQFRLRNWRDLFGATKILDAQLRHEYDRFT